MTEPRPDDEPSPEFTLAVTYPAANREEAEWLAGFAVQALRCDPTTTEWTVTDA